MPIPLWLVTDERRVSFAEAERESYQLAAGSPPWAWGRGTGWPCTPTGKVEKFKLREMGVTGETWDLKKSSFEVMR